MIKDTYKFNELIDDMINFRLNKSGDEVGDFNHCSVIFTKINNELLKIVSYGNNKYMDNINKNRNINQRHKCINKKVRVKTIHAESDAVNRLPPIMKINKKKMNINLVVIRVNKLGNLCNSMPCMHCIKMMYIKPRNMGYKIDKVYYSDNNGEIIYCKLNDLLDEEIHISKFYEITGYDINGWMKWRDMIKNKQMINLVKIIII